MLLIGLDIGTTGCKASLFTTEGRLLGSVSREYVVDFPHPNWAEQDGEKVWSSAQEAMRELYQKFGKADRVLAIGLSVQGEAVVPVDEKGSPLRAFILGMDTRTGEENRWLKDKFGGTYLFQRTGIPVHTVNTLPKLIWLKNHEPDVWKKASKFLLYEDFLIMKMTGKPYISGCLASRTQMYDLQAGDWWPEVLDTIGLDVRRLAEVKPSGTAAGDMLPELAKNLGFPNTPVISTGGHDQSCGALGAGLITAGLSSDSTGTAEVVEVAMDTPALSPILEKSNISVYEHVVRGMYVAMTLNQSGGFVLRWFRDNFGAEEKARSAAGAGDAYDLLLEGVSTEPSSLLFMPHLSGSGTPLFDIESKGALLGVTFSTSKRDVAKAILEGLCFELAINMDVLKDGGVKVDELRAIGGGAKSTFWMQLKADVTGIKVVTPKITEAASWGASILAGVAAGHFKSVTEVIGENLTFNKVYEPDPKRHSLYRERYELYKQIHPTLAPLLHKM